MSHRSTKKLRSHKGQTSKVTHFSAGTRGWNFHWSSSTSNTSRFMILFFSSGGMKFSIMRYLYTYTYR